MSRQSPLVEIVSGNTIVDLESISITEKPYYSQYILRGLADDAAFTNAVKTIVGIDLPHDANTRVNVQGLSACWMSPDQWLLITDDLEYTDKFSMLFGALQAVYASINEVSSGQTIVTIKGEKALEVLNKGTTLDVHPDVFKPGQCAQVVFAKTNVLICPISLDAPLEYDLIVRRSFADFLGRWLINATTEYKL